MSHATNLRQLLQREEQVLIVPGGGTPIEALIAERAGFEAFI